jgi:hypothetical protein
VQLGGVLVEREARSARKENMTAQNAEKLKLAGAVAALGLAGVGFFRFYKSSNPPEGRAYFYDQSAKKLFVAPHSSVPPIKGIEGQEEDAVRAVVISTSGNCLDESSRKIAYLETYTPELKRQVESRQNNGPNAADTPAVTIRRGEAHALILVRRPAEMDWHPMTSPEAQEILRTISTPGPDGKMPVVCIP